MHLQRLITIFAVATTIAAHVYTTSVEAVSDDDTSHLAPFIETCPAGRSTCGKIEGKYMVTLRKGYKASSHLSYVSTNIHVDPVKEWQLK